jgi:hypothetical protein
VSNESSACTAGNAFGSAGDAPVQCEAGFSRVVHAASDFGGLETGGAFRVAADAGAVSFLAGAGAVSAGALAGAKGFFGEMNFGRNTCLFS